MVDLVCVSVGGMVLVWIVGININYIFNNEGTIDLEVQGVVLLPLRIGFMKIDYNMKILRGLLLQKNL